MRLSYITIKLLELEPLRLSYEINPDLLARKFESVCSMSLMVILLAALAFNYFENQVRQFDYLPAVVFGELD